MNIVFAFDATLSQCHAQMRRHEVETVMYMALSRGLSFKLTMGNIITLTPSLTITKEKMNKALDIIEECIAEVEETK
jgi:4-aminobutyrate aminotransferase-like enzyme